METTEKNEITSDLLVEALNQASLVSKINKKILELEELKKEAEKKGKKGQIVLFSEEVSMKIVEAATSGDRICERNTFINKMEIYCILSANSSSIERLSNFFLKLNLYSKADVYSFLIAKNNKVDAGYLVQTKNDKLLIQDGGLGRIKFSSVEDFRKVINYCDECIIKFNGSLKGKKLIPHFNEPIISFD